jgi:rfaE bifunctional protein nucleotidyltransferase chain/domain
MSRIITDYDELARVCAEQRRIGRTVVFTNGAFDIVHVGHVRCLLGAAEAGDFLVVGLNSDESIRRNKGPGRPAQPLDERMEIVAAVRGVDVVTWFDEPTCDRMLEIVRPHVHAKGRDYTLETLPEGPTLKRIGARLAIVGDEKNHSTTQVLHRWSQSAARQS